jgi:hypothetical protein
MTISFDSLNTEYKECDCVITSELNIIENIIEDQFIILCKTHYMQTSNKKEYIYNKHKSIYVLNSFLSTSSNKNKIKKSASNISLDSDGDTSNIILFGKYKYKTFNYVYNNDKIYCYNLSIWNNSSLIFNSIHSTNINNFIDFVKESIKVY